MKYQAKFYDGQTSKGYERRYSISQGRLLMCEPDGTLLESIPISELVLLQIDAPRGKVLFTFSKNSSARFYIEKADYMFLKSDLNKYGLKKKVQFTSSMGMIIALTVVAIIFIALIYWSIPKLARPVAHLIPLSVEMTISEYLFEQDGQVEGECSTIEGSAALDKMVEKLTSKSPFEGVLNIKVVKSEQVNAYATLGNRIVIFTGLLEFVESQDELAGIVAHELGHVHYRHPIVGAVRYAGFGMLVDLMFGQLSETTILALSELLVGMKHSRSMEIEADNFARETLAKAKLSTAGLKAFFARLNTKESERFADYLKYLSTHPTHQERLESLNQNRSFQSKSILSSTEWKNLQNICN